MKIARISLPPIILAYIAAAIIGITVLGAPLFALGIPALLLATLLAWGIFRPGSRLLYPTTTRGSRESNHVALTFDDGPDPDTTPSVLDLLARHNARATFFVIGSKLAEHPKLARRMIAGAHTIGNHTWQHSRWQNFYPRRTFEREIERGEQAIMALSRDTRPLYRPPVGIKTPTLARIAYRRSMHIVAWSLHSHDSRLHDPERIAQRVLEKVRPGDIILMHDGHDLPGKSRPVCAESLELILRGLKERNLESVPVPELLDTPIRTAPNSSTDARVAARQS